jgi:hypothetical protein
MYFLEFKRLFNYDEKLYEKLNNYHNIMTSAKKFVKKYIIELIPEIWK